MRTTNQRQVAGGSPAIRWKILRLLAACLVMGLAVPAMLAQTWTGSTSTTWSTAGNWSGGVPGNNSIATFDSSTPNDPNLTANATVGQLLFAAGADAETFTGASLTLRGVSGVGIDNQSGVAQTFDNTLLVGLAQSWNADSGDLLFNNVTLNNTLTLTGSAGFTFGGTFLNNGGNRTLTNDATGSLSLSGDVRLSNNNTARTLTFGGTGDTLVSGNIVNGGNGAGRIVKTGTGTLTLSGANTYTGTTAIGTSGGASGGTLRLGAADNLSNAATTVYAGTLDLNGFNDAIGALTLGGGASGTTATVTTGAGTLTLGGNLTYSSTNNTDGATVSGNLDLGAANRSFIANNSTAADTDLTIAADITAANRNLTVTGTGNALISGSIATGSGTLTKSGTGTLTLSGANTYTGLTSVTGGVLNIQHSSALGTTDAGTNVTSGEALQIQGDISVGAEALGITGTGVSNTGALRNISGDNSYAGLVTLAGNTTFASDSGSLALTGGVTGTNRTLTLNGDGDFSLGGITTGSGALLKNGAGTTTLTGTNTYTGATTIDAGALRLGTSESVSNLSAVTVASGAVFDVNNQTETIASLAGAGDVDLGSGSLTAAGNASTTFSGALLGDGTFTKLGTGTLTLDTDFSFDGTFNLESGTLRLSDMALTLGTLNITGNSIIDFAGVSSLNVTSFNIGAGVTLTIQNWADASDYFFTQFWTGASFDMTGASPMDQVVFAGFTTDDTKWQGYDRQVTPVPEPSTYGALLLVVTGGLIGWHRRRANRRGA